MNGPNKPFEKWTYRELCDAAAWEVIQSLLKGTSLHDTMWAVCQTVIAWHKEQKK